MAPGKREVSQGKGTAGERPKSKVSEDPGTNPRNACWPEGGQSILERESEVRELPPPLPSSPPSSSFLALLWGLRGQLVRWVEGYRKEEGAHHALPSPCNREPGDSSRQREGFIFKGRLNCEFTLGIGPSGFGIETVLLLKGVLKLCMV